jgi:hypothetical protein
MRMTIAFRTVGIPLFAAALVLLSIGAQGPRPPLAHGAQLAGFDAVAVTRSMYDETLHHNVPDLQVTADDGQVLNADFLSFFEQTGRVDRWGLPISEVLQEEDGNLAQYFQRGVVDWHKRADLGGAYLMERRLAWDYFGGGAGGSLDLGTEPTQILHTSVGVQLGPWGHEVSNVSTDGTETNFLDFFQRYGGVDSFGFPKTDARVDTNAAGSLFIPAATSGFTRQYFQAAVFESHPEQPDSHYRVQLRLLGDDLRNALYPEDAWQQFRSFIAAEPLTPGVYLVERVQPRPAETTGVTPTPPTPTIAGQGAQTNTATNSSASSTSATSTSVAAAAAASATTAAAAPTPDITPAAAATTAPATATTPPKSSNTHSNPSTSSNAAGTSTPGTSTSPTAAPTKASSEPLNCPPTALVPCIHDAILPLMTGLGAPELPPLLARLLGLDLSQVQAILSGPGTPDDKARQLAIETVNNLTNVAFKAHFATELVQSSLAARTALSTSDQKAQVLTQAISTTSADASLASQVTQAKGVLTQVSAANAGLATSPGSAAQVASALRVSSATIALATNVANPSPATTALASAQADALAASTAAATAVLEAQAAATLAGAAH